MNDVNDGCLTMGEETAERFLRVPFRNHLLTGAFIRPFHHSYMLVIVGFPVYPCLIVPCGPVTPRETSSRLVCSLVVF